jgi:hypothetical protein
MAFVCDDGVYILNVLWIWSDTALNLLYMSLGQVCTSELARIGMTELATVMCLLLNRATYRVPSKAPMTKFNF